MRWDEQKVENDLRLPGIGDGTRIRTFDAPEAMGINFHEVRARSALNHVPGGRFGFSWTINPYRGCSHACVYCQLGDTQILMGDGTTKDLADLRAGDLVYGTEVRGAYRRYVLTEVLNHWQTRKAAYRIRLEDGTELIASGDHRYLTEQRGWKHVTGAEQGRGRRPYLTPNNSLLGTGKFAPPPGESAEYRQGYLCGLIRGDGHLAFRSYTRPGGFKRRYQAFRLALTDFEALARARRYLTEMEIETSEFEFAAATGNRRQVLAIRAQAHTPVAMVQEAIQWPDCPSEDWSKGFLAGVFDAEGSYAESLRIANTDAEIIQWTVRCLDRFRFSTMVEKRRGHANGLTYVRVKGGLPEHLRFFHSVNPAITRKRSIVGRAIKTTARLTVQSIEPLGMDLPMFDITTGTGDFIANGVVSHNCFARRTHTYLDFDAGRDFEREIVVKVNVPELLRHELRRPSWRRELVALGTNTDPYQWVESRYRMMPEILAALEGARTPVSVLTKSPLALRDVDRFERMVKSGLKVSVNLSVPTLDEGAWRATEPHTPSPSARLDAVAELRRRGIESGVLIAPLMPGINDSPEQVEPIAERAREADATFLGGVALHLRDEVKDVFFAWLQSKRPDLIPRYEALYKNRAYMKPPQRKHATRALKTWGANRRRPSRGTDVAVGDSGGDSENENLARRSLPPRQAPPPQRTLF